MRIALISLMILFSAGCALADGPTTRPLSADSSIDDVLDALKTRGDDLKDFSATAQLTVTDTDTGEDAYTNSGPVLFQKLPDGDSRVLVHFEKKTIAGLTKTIDHLYKLEGGWLIERDGVLKLENKYQVAKPGKKIDLLKLGEGPFPLPIGQDKDAVKEQFDVAKIAPAKDDPAGTVHLQLTPKADSSLAHKFKTIDVWVDLQTNMPVRIVTLDRNGAKSQTTDLVNVKMNSGLSDKDFALPDVGPGWNETSEPFKE